MKRLLIAIMVITSVGCEYRVQRDPAEIVMTLQAEPSLLNPLLSTDSYASMVESHVYETLFERDNETLEFKPKLATRWEVSSDKLQYTFYLRRDVRWHDGEPFTADDVLSTFKRIQDPKVDAAVQRQAFRDVEWLEKLDDYTVRFTYKRPYFRGLFVTGGMAILPKHIFNDGHDFNTHPANRKPIGTGPYRFASWETGRKIVVRRNETYWGKKPELTAVVFKIVPDDKVAFQLLKKGGIDLASIRSIQWERQTQSESFRQKFEKYRYYLPNYSYIAWNLRRPFFQDRRVRQAMTMLVDRQSILEKQLFSQGKVVTGTTYRFGSDYDDSIEPWPYDPDGAAKLLDDAGWIDHNGDGIRDKDGIPFRFTYLIPSSSGVGVGRSIGLFLREELSKVGIDMNIQQLEWATMLKQLQEHSFDATSLAWALPLDIDLYQLWHSSQAEEGSNVIGFNHPEVDRLLEEARLEFDADERAALYRRLHRILHEEQPYTFLFTNPALVVISRRFSNVRAYKIGIDPLEWGVQDQSELLAW